MTNIAIFASGSGSNAEAIAHFFHTLHPEQGVRVSCIIANRKGAYVLERAERLAVPGHFVPNDRLNDPHYLLPLLKEHEVEYIVLAGFLALVPAYLIEAFPHKIINIHPALLPKYGGKGMYGMNVHEAVHRSGDRESGITIHLIDEEYDRGTIVFQARTELAPEDTPEDIANKVHSLEYRHFPEVIAHWICGNL